MQSYYAQLVQPRVKCKFDLKLLAVSGTADKLCAVVLEILVVHGRPTTMNLAAKWPEAVQVDRSFAYSQGQ